MTKKDRQTNHISYVTYLRRCGDELILKSEPPGSKTNRQAKISSGERRCGDKLTMFLYLSWVPMSLQVSSIFLCNQRVPEAAIIV